MELRRSSVFLATISHVIVMIGSRVGLSAACLQSSESNCVNIVYGREGFCFWLDYSRLQSVCWCGRRTKLSCRVGNDDEQLLSSLSLSSVDVLVLLLLTSCVACCTAAESSGGNGNNEHSMATESNIIQLELSYSRALILHTRQRPINHVPSSKKMPSNFLLFQLFHWSEFRWTTRVFLRMESGIFKGRCFRDTAF